MALCYLNVLLTQSLLLVVCLLSSSTMGMKDNQPCGMGDIHINLVRYMTSNSP